MPRRSRFSDWKSSAYTGVAELGAAETTMMLIGTSVISLILAVIGAYMIINTRSIAINSKKECDKEKAQAETAQGPAADCTPFNNAWLVGSIMILVAAVIFGAAYMNQRLSKKYKGYAALQGGMFAGNIISGLL